MTDGLGEHPLEEWLVGGDLPAGKSCELCLRALAHPASEDHRRRAGSELQRHRRMCHGWHNFTSNIGPDAVPGDRLSVAE